MRVQIHPTVMSQPERHGRDLNAIVDTFDTGQHAWVIDDLDVITSSRWVSERASWDSLLTELAEKMYRTAIDEVDSLSSRQRLLIVSLEAEVGAFATPNGAAFYAAPASAREILAKPAYLVLESATSDWHFLSAMARVFACDSLMQAIDRAWLVPEHGGGSGDFLKRIDGLLERGIVKERIIALTDSDRLAPGPLPEKVAGMVDNITSRGATVIVLFKREIENYLPDTALDGKRTHDARVSFLELTRIQRDHFDMKSGFKADKNTGQISLLPEQHELFANTNPWHLGRLKGGFGAHIGDQFKKSEISREEMIAVCETCPGEIERILRTIEEVL